MTDAQYELALLQRINSSLNDLLDRQIERTKFLTLRIPATAFTNANKGIQIGRGACRGIAIQPNINVLNSTATAALQARVFYIGDQDAQLWNISGAVPFTIPCRDLSEIWVRNQLPSTGVGAVDIYAQVMVFLGRRDEIEINPDLRYE